ncbi:MAG: mechanosensitive ion channel [Candidatus Heimdallarchaeota archaeon]|nr:mechanosensitive ion channel [Candidatus Heimdallarchaeota archaeon]
MATILEWLTANLNNIIISSVTLIIGFVVNRVIKYEIKSLVNKQKIKERNGKIIKRILNILVFLIITLILFVQYASSLGFLTAMLTIMGGTVIGFAAMSTIGNFLAGVIIMISKPFSVGDRIEFDGQLADVIDIEFIFTKIRPINGTVVAIPNQEFLKGAITNLGKEDIVVMRNVSVTLDYSLVQEDVTATLLNSIKNLDLLDSENEPFVTINDFLDYAVEYKLYYYIKKVKNILMIESEVKKKVFQACKNNGFEISVPLLIKDVN